MLDGEIAYRATDYDAAWSHLRRAIELDDGLPYDEPPLLKLALLL